ncbi:MAG TPA: 3-phosphoglycerate dehydrogenase [Clostridiales bacterium]|nr:3-phosphoglycerate dehydrogenase [Clostridiales bacterium]
MKNIKLLNKIDKIGTDVFNTSKYALSDKTENPCGIMVRSAVMHEMEFGSDLLAIARAGAGVNNIPIERCSEKGIVVFNTPGANANGVKELAIASLLLSSRKIVDGINWANNLKGQSDVEKLVEKGKSKFTGPELKGKTLGVIGLGAIGGMVANVAYSLGMEVMGCDPYITVNAAWSLSRAVVKAENYDEIYCNCDYITLHVPSVPSAIGLINKDSITKMKDGVRIVNLSRGDIVNTADILEALASGKVAAYVTDFPCEELLGVEGVIAIPHLGASTLESEENCAFMAAQQMVDYLENGNIRNSVNYPEIILPRVTMNRVVVLHENIPNMLAQVSTVLSSFNINIESLLSHAKGTNAVSLYETNDEVGSSVVEKILAIPGVRRVMVI